MKCPFQVLPVSFETFDKISLSRLFCTTKADQPEFARSQGRVVFTQDRDFLKLHYAGTDHVGIAYCIKDSRSIGEILRGLILIWEVLDPDEISGRVEFL